MKREYLIIVIVAAIAAALSVAVWKVGMNPPASVREGVSTGQATIGGPFTLTNQNGKVVKDTDFKGKLMLVFFGFTYCPDVCPTDLMVMSKAMKELGDDAKQVAPIFISIDPERDTPAQLKTYLSNFDSRITGLTGSQEQIDQVIGEYRVYANKVHSPDSTDYTMDHSAFLYLMGKDGVFITHFRHNPKVEEVVTEIRGALGK